MFATYLHGNHCAMESSEHVTEVVLYKVGLFLLQLRLLHKKIMQYDLQIFWEPGKDSSSVLIAADGFGVLKRARSFPTQIVRVFEGKKSCSSFSERGLLLCKHPLSSTTRVDNYKFNSFLNEEGRKQRFKTNTSFKRANLFSVATYLPTTPMKMSRN